MTPRWVEIERVFNGALELPKETRAAYLAEACAGDPDLRAEVESLLEHETGTVAGLSTAIGNSARALALAGEPRPGEHIGPYRIVRVLGRGGMGVVFEAARDDGHYQQRVAVKLVASGADFEAVHARFRQERQILAALSHPNIATILDGGGLGDGRPYLVLEYVEGRPIAPYCEERGLGLRERLTLFRSVCAAVQHAHARLVVHRDLKPANVLVTADGEPKLLDFGIAKLVAREAEGDPLTTTLQGPMTPDYASPEQVRGEPLGTATDVYSLGILLFEMLTGRRPFATGARNLLEVERAICHQPLPLPSSVCSEPRWRGLLRGDVDNIVARAARKEPDRRYPSVEALSADVGRFLENRPVEARPDTALYRARKFAGRHPAALTFAAVALLSLLAGFATALHQARRAERRFQQVRQLAHELLFDLHGDIAKLPGATVARERLVTTALRYLDELAREAGSDMSLLQELAAAYEKVGDVQGRAQGPNRGQPQAARSSYAKGLALVEEVAAEGGSGRGLSGLRGRLQLKLAVLDREAGDTTAAHAGLLQSLAAIAELEGLAGLTDEDFALIGDIYSTAGDFALRRDGAEALRHYEGALRTAERWAREHPGDRAQHSRSLAEARRADALAKRGDLEACLAGYRRAITLREELVRRDPMNVHWRRELKVLYNWLGNFLGGREFINAGDRRAALDHYRRGLAMSEELAAADPEDARGRLDLAIGYWKVGGLLIETSPREARTLLSRSLAIVERLRQGAPESFELRRREATFRFALAEATWGDGDRPAALAMLRGTVREGVVLLDQDPADGDVRALLLSSRRRLGEMLLAEGAGDEARRLLEGSEEQARRWSEESPHDLHARWTFAESLGSLAYYHRARAAKTSRSADQRRADEKTACTLLLRRLDLWTSWPKVAVSSVFDQSRRREAERAVASCGSKDA